MFTFNNLRGLGTSTWGMWQGACGKWQGNSDWYPRWIRFRAWTWQQTNKQTTATTL